MPDHDVLIVGAGPVGLLLACLLTQRGRDVLVCERRVDADPRTRAIGIHRPGLDALDVAGVGAEARTEALSLEGGDVRSRRRLVAALTFPPERPVLLLPQRRTDALLRSRLGDLDGAALRGGCTVRAVRDEGDLVRAIVDSGDGPREVTASLAVLADGVRSRLRDDLGLGWRRRAGGAAYAMLDVADPTAGRRAVLHCEPGGLVESFPLPGGMRRWVVRQDPAGPPTRTAAAFGAAVEARTGIRPQISDDDEPALFTAAQHTARRLVAGRIVLLGDAAHEVSPIGGQGMNLGWRDALRLAEAITASRAGAVPALTAFARAVRRSARAAQRRSLFYMSMGAPVAPSAARAREGAIRMLGARPLRGWTTGLVTMRGL